MINDSKYLSVDENTRYTGLSFVLLVVLFRLFIFVPVVVVAFCSVPADTSHSGIASGLDSETVVLCCCISAPPKQERERETNVYEGKESHIVAQ